MLEGKTDFAAGRFSPFRSARGDWFVVDQDRDDRRVFPCPDADGAVLIAALMNGDIAALAGVTEETLARCREILLDMFRSPKRCGLPSVGAEAFPRI